MCFLFSLWTSHSRKTRDFRYHITYLLVSTSTYVILYPFSGLTSIQASSDRVATKMYIYLGKLNYSPYAENEIFSVTFRENAKCGDKVVVIHQWTKDDSGQQKKNSFAEGTINKAVEIRQGVKEIEFFERERDETYYW